MTIIFRREGIVLHKETGRVVGGWRKEPDAPPYKRDTFRVWKAGEAPEAGRCYWPRYMGSKHFDDIEYAYEMGYLDDPNDEAANEHIFVRGRSDRQIAHEAIQALRRVPPLPWRVENHEGKDMIVDARGLPFLRGETYSDGWSGLSGEETRLDALVGIINAMSHLAPRLRDDDLNDDLRRLPGRPWELWSSCSYHRISKARGGDGSVLTASRDGSLSLNEKSLNALCRVVSSAGNLLAPMLTSEAEPEEDDPESVWLP